MIVVDMRGRWRRLLCGLLLSLPALRGYAADRVVSLNLCTDQMLVLLAPEKIAALSPLAGDASLSSVAQQAQRLPSVRASAEAVLRLHPDLILAAAYGAQATLVVLQQEHIPILRIELPQDLAGVRQTTRQIADTLGATARGEELLARMDAELAKLPHEDRGIRSLVWEPRGFTAGPGTLMDALLHAAGLSNMSDGRRVGMETLLRHPPDLLIVPTVPAYPSLATTMLQHPALAGVPRRMIPPALTICAGPFSAQAVALLAQ
jgi:iron complex transport system substrate-binding protein